jgi:hypothetical protein
MSVTSFGSEQNVRLLLEIIMDEEIVQQQPLEAVNQIQTVFYNNLRGFYENHKNTYSTLMEFNKQYILLMLRFVHNEIVKPVITPFLFEKSNGSMRIENAQRYKKQQQRVTFEDIQNHKRSQFEQELNAKQSEFTGAMTRPVPPVPKFSDDTPDDSFVEMELAIKQMTEQRKYDVEQITNNYLPPPQQQKQLKKNQGIRYITIEPTEATIDPTAIVDLDSEKNIFTKLKKVDELAVLQNEMRELRAKVDALTEMLLATNASK